MANQIKSYSKTNWLLKSFLYAFIIAIALLIYGYHFPSSNNLIEIPPVLALINPELYKNDYYVRELLQITPRYYYQYLIYLTTAKLGLDLYFTYFLYYVIAFSSFIVGVYALGKRFGQSQLAASVLVFLAFSSFGGTVGYVSLFRAEPIPAVLAMGLTIWGFYFGFIQRWKTSYLFFGLACLVQFLIGVLPGLLMMPLLIVDAKKNNNFAKIIPPLFILGIFAFSIYLPMKISGNTSSGLISNQEFIYLYGYLRHPHHIIPSHFPIQNWRSFIFLMASGVLCIKSSDSLHSEDKQRLLIVILTSLFTLLIGYIFVEIYPVALIAKLQLARTTPFAQLMIIIAISVLIKEHYRQKNLAICILLLVTLINKNGTILLFLVTLGLVVLKKINKLRLLRSRLITGIIILSSLLFLALYPSPASPTVAFNRIVLKIILFLVLAFPFFIEEFEQLGRLIKTMVYPLAIVSWMFLMLGLLGSLPENLSKFVQSQISGTRSQVTPKDQVTRLALRFREQSEEDALILTPPSLTKFRFYSQRSTVYTFYSFPYTDRGVQEWANRLEAILGKIQPPLSHRNLDMLYRNRSSFELVKAARQFGANYVLTRSDWHSNLEKIVDREGKWVIYKITSDN